MDESTIKLFKDDSTNVAMPSISIEQTEEQAKLTSDDISSDISGETVKVIRVKEDVDIDPENFVLDLSDIDQVSASQKEVLKSLVIPDGTVSVYLYKKQGLIRLGGGDKYTLERLLPIIKEHVFNGELNVYKNFERGKPVETIDCKDITKLRLRL